ncbi:MAG: hypothetical protein ACFFBD_01880 [Candidatus Hodarchaeota archaeon]
MSPSEIILFFMNLISLIVGLGLVALILYHYRQRRVRLLLLLASSFLIFALSNIASLFFPRVGGLDPSSFPSAVEHFRLSFTFTAISIAHLVAIYIALYILVIFLDLFENDSITPKRTGIFSLIFGYLLSFPLLFYFFFTINSILTNPQIISNPFFLAVLPVLYISVTVFIFSIVIFTLGVPFIFVRTLGRMLKNFQSPQHRRQIRFMQFGIILLFLGAFEPLFLQLVGTLIFSYGYLGSGMPILRPKRIDRLLVLDSSGLTLFSMTFGLTVRSIDEYLLGGLISAITSMIQATAQSTATIRSIKLEDLELMMVMKHSILSVLVVEHSSIYLSSSLESFTQAFYNQFKEKIGEEVIEVNYYAKYAKPLAEAYFGSGVDSPSSSS